MQIRGVIGKRATLVAGALTGALLPPDAFSGEPVRMLVTFLGLVAASILPTVSLCIGSLSSTGRSVQKVQQLYLGLTRAVRSLFLTFWWVGASVGVLLILAVTPDVSFSFEVGSGFVYVTDMPRRATQALAFACSVTAVLRAIEIPPILMEVLASKRDIAVYEAREELRGNVPGELELKQMFAKKPGFGDKVPLRQDLG